MKEALTFERFASTLSREGSLWMESAFCKELQGGALLFSDPMEVVTLSSPSALQLFFQRLEQKLAQGLYLAGWLTYEAGYGFEERLLHLPPPDAHQPLGWFGVYREPERFSASQVAALFAEAEARSSLTINGLSFNLSEAAYKKKIETIKGQIAAGNLYQVNFTGRYRFTFKGSPSALFSALRATQPSSYTALINSGGRTILSLSPELFFRRSGTLVETRPMKGTAPRGRTAEEDRCLKEGLGRCQKNRAENLMIVDLLRNDLGRICKPGSVEAEELFATESWPTLHQLVSTIRGEEREEVGLFELFRALYPSGSITGAPKINAMKLIQSLEAEPRGIYTGTIGYITPEREMLFSVAIRTIELSGNQGLYGSGGGIVWDSDPEEEYRECRLKAKILSASSRKPFQLFESLLWNGSYLWLEQHIERLATSAAALGFPCETAAATLLLRRLEEELRQHAARFKVRLSLSSQGAFSITHEPIKVQHSTAPLRLCIAAERTDSANPLLYHKTTSRELYDRTFTLARQQGYDEVLFLNEREELTEGAISTLFIRKGRQLLTPPLHSGLLNGIFRRYLLATRPFAHENVITLHDLETAAAIFIANSVRGLRPATLSPRTHK
jgi:para-aminobenzoate synthetase/4-amino-4-deoxychorismate lyase